MKKWGKKVYVIAADYNYGQITSQWGEEYVTENGGEVSSIDFFPLDVTNFGSTISKIQAAKPDFVWSALVAARIYLLPPVGRGRMRKSIPMASTTFAVGNEHIVLSPDECTACWSATTTSRIEEQSQRNLCCSFPQTFWRRLPNVTDSRWEPIKASVSGRRRSRKPQC